MNSDSKNSDWSQDENNFKEDETYTSIFNRIGEAVSESETLFEFLKKALSIFYYSRLSTLLMALLSIFHLAMVYTGIVYLAMNCLVVD